MLIKVIYRGFIISVLLCCSLLNCNTPALAKNLYKQGKNKITRGPYLQIPTPDSIHVRWRTEYPTASLIEYGTQKSQLKSSQSLALLTTEHDLVLRNLEPNTKYFYSIYEYRDDKKKLLIGNSEKYYFITPASINDKFNFKAWILGDQGTGERTQKKTKKAFEKYNKDLKLDFILTLGSNAYEEGTDEQYQKLFFDFYESFLARIPVYTSFGEHDGGMIEGLRGATAISYPEPKGIYFDNFTLPSLGEAGGVGSKTEAYYSFNYGNAHFVVLDSFDSHWDSRMLEWLDLDLMTNNQDWTIVSVHHPPYSARIKYHLEANQTNKWVLENVVPILEKHNVDLVLSSQIAKYERTEQIKNGRNVSPDNALKANSIYSQGHGPIYVVAGNSGRLDEDLLEAGRSDYSIMHKAIYESGFLVLDISAINLGLSFVNEKAKLKDHFDIIRVIE